jgi:hypothetical protein
MNFEITPLDFPDISFTVGIFNTYSVSILSNTLQTAYRLPYNITPLSQLCYNTYTTKVNDLRYTHRLSFFERSKFNELWEIIIYGRVEL